MTVMGNKLVPEFSIGLMILLISVIPLCVFITSAETNESTAESALVDAEASIVSAYREVLRAEKVGANASSLLSRLTDSGKLLARARVAYMLRYFDNTSSFAASSKNISEDVKNAAVKLAISARSENLKRMLLAPAASIISMILIALGSLWVWHIISARVQKRFDGMQSEN